MFPFLTNTICLILLFLLLKPSILIFRDIILLTTLFLLLSCLFLQINHPAINTVAVIDLNFKRTMQTIGNPDCLSCYDLFVNNFILRKKYKGATDKHARALHGMSGDSQINSSTPCRCSSSIY